MKTATKGADMDEATYRVGIINKLNRRAVELQTLGRWEEADNLLFMARRYEALWERLDANR